MCFGQGVSDLWRLVEINVGNCITMMAVIFSKEYLFVLLREKKNTIELNKIENNKKTNFKLTV